MGPRIDLPAFDFVPFRGHVVLSFLVRDVSGNGRLVSDEFRWKKEVSFGSRGWDGNSVPVVCSTKCKLLLPMG